MCEFKNKRKWDARHGIFLSRHNLEGVCKGRVGWGICKFLNHMHMLKIKMGNYGGLIHEKTFRIYLILVMKPTV